MTKGGRKRRGDELTPEQREERFSTGGVGFEESLRRVLGGPNDGFPGDQENDVTEGFVRADASPTADLEILDRLAGFEQAVIDGTIDALPSVREQLRDHLTQRGL